MPKKQFLYRYIIIIIQFIYLQLTIKKKLNFMI